MVPSQLECPISSSPGPSLYSPPELQCSWHAHPLPRPGTLHSPPAPDANGKATEAANAGARVQQATKQSSRARGHAQPGAKDTAGPSARRGSADAAATRSTEGRKKAPLVGPQVPPAVQGPHMDVDSGRGNDDRTNFASRKDGAKVVAANPCAMLSSAQGDSHAQRFTLRPAYSTWRLHANTAGQRRLFQVQWQ